tara:strand:- start:1473 stop:1934 length:462 start_codon:yes stop_codon:yes gene_type:complete
MFYKFLHFLFGRNKKKRRFKRGDLSKISKTITTTASNVIPFKSKKPDSEWQRKKEIDRIDDLSKELVNSFNKTTSTSTLEPGTVYYYFLFRVLQRMIFSMNYSEYRWIVKDISKQIVERFKEIMKTYPEIGDHYDNKTLFEKDKEKNNDKTIH